MNQSCVHEAIDSLPKGPVEQVDVYYAGSRLAFSVLGFRIWGAAAPKGALHLCFTRVMEKGCHFALAALRDLLEKLDLISSDSLTFWSDNGRHFNANRTLATQGTKLFIPGGSINTVNVYFGLPKHCKNVCDSGWHG